MRQKRFLLLAGVLLFLVSCTETVPAFPWYSGDIASAKLIAGSRMIQIDFYTDT